MTTWLVLGSSVSAPAEYERAKPFADVIITSNRGLKIEPNPDWYWVSDHVAVDRYLPLIEPSLGNKTKLVTNDFAVRTRPQLKPLADVILNYDYKYNCNWHPGRYVNARASGGMILQFAANHDADRILMVGMSGYRSRPGHIEVEYFDGELGVIKCQGLMKTYGPLVQNVIDRSSGITFFFFGKPSYPWRGMSIIETQSTDTLKSPNVAV
jgi:hypothetical protein